MANQKMFVKYSKTKAEFIAAGLPSTYNNSIVFIQGDANGNGSCIYTHGMYFGNFAEFLAAVNYVKGVKVGTDTYNAAANGGYVAFEASTPQVVTLDVNNGKIQLGLTADFINKVNNTSTNLGSTGDAADANGSAFARIAKLAADLNALTGDSEGSIEDLIGNAIDDLRTELSGDWSKIDNGQPIEPMSIAEVVVTMTYAINGINGSIEAITKDYLKAADKKELSDAIDALNADVGDVDSLSTTNKEVVSAINEVLAAVGTGGTAAVVTVTSKGATTDYANVYEIKQGDAVVGTINIPKELVVSNGEVVTNPTGKPAGTYIKLTLQNVADPLYIDVAKLVDVYTAKQNAAQVQLSIDASNVISATIVAGSISATELASNAVTTVKIADKNVTKDKLSEAVQTSLGKADSAVQSIATGSLPGSIDVDGSPVAVAGLKSAAYTEATAYATSAQGAKADTAVQSASAYGISTSTSAGTEVAGMAYITANVNNTALSIEFLTGYVAQNKDGLARAVETRAYIDSLWEWEEL